MKDRALGDIQSVLDRLAREMGELRAENAELRRNSIGGSSNGRQILKSKENSTPS